MTRRRSAQSAPASRIPELASYEEEAEFWDTHDFTEFWDEMKPVQVRFAKNLSDGITVILDAEMLSALNERAREQGVAPETLVRTWIAQQLRKKRRYSTSRRGAAR